ncbi:MAG TPA: hypothetical protein VGH26_10685 [Gaiellaceae bacterium]|jgi:hypothetical protein
MRVLGRPIRWRSWKGGFLVAVAVAALAGAGVGIAAGFGAFDESSPFDGISAAQHPPTAADKLDPAVAASFAPDLRRDAGIVRFVTQLGDGVRIYAVATAGGGLCSIAERLPGPHTVKGKPTEIACGTRLTQKRPTTLTSFLATGERPPFSWGIALDNVTAVSFTAGGQEVTVPLKDNVWAYHGKKDLIGAVPLTVHFTDGSTEKAIG